MIDINAIKQKTTKAQEELKNRQRIAIESIIDKKIEEAANLGKSYASIFSALFNCTNDHVEKVISGYTSAGYSYEWNKEDCCWIIRW